MSKGGYTFSKAYNDSDNLSLWAQYSPNLTIIHLGSVDITEDRYNWDGSNPRAVYNMLIEYLDKLIETAKSNYTESAFKEFKQNHKFLVFGTADWGNFVSNFKSNLNPYEYR